MTAFKKKHNILFLGNMNIGYRLLSPVIVMLFLFAAIGTLGSYGMKRESTGTDTLYRKNILPLNDLQGISDMYAMNVVKSVQRIRDNAAMGDKSLWKDGRKNVDEAIKVASEKWKDYAAMGHTEKEKTLISQTQPLFGIAKEPLDKLKDALAKEDLQNLNNFFIDELYPTIEPIEQKLAE